MTLAVLACSIDDRELLVQDAAPAPKGILLLPDSQAFVNGSNAAGITGYWYVQWDSPTCQAVGGYSADQCSMLFTPAGGLLLPSDLETGRMCTSGLLAQVIDNPATMAPDYQNIWGAQIGLHLNDARPYDARAHMVTGFSFMIDSPPSAGLRIEFPTVDNPATGAYWGGSWSFTSPVARGLNEIRWTDVGGPLYLANPPAFDETTLLEIQFHVSTSADHAIPYDFCVSNLAALTD